MNRVNLLVVESSSYKQTWEIYYLCDSLRFVAIIPVVDLSLYNILRIILDLLSGQTCCSYKNLFHVRAKFIDYLEASLGFEVSRIIALSLIEIEWIFWRTKKSLIPLILYETAKSSLGASAVLISFFNDS